MIVDVTKNLQDALGKPSELTADEIEEFRSYDAKSYSMRRIGLPYVVWVYTYKTESSPIIKITEPSTECFIIVSHEEE